MAKQGQGHFYLYSTLLKQHKFDTGAQNHWSKFFETEIYTSSESWINKLVMIGQYLAEIQLFENLESEGAKKSKYWENHL